jgi:hypothetical protein
VVDAPSKPIRAAKRKAIGPVNEAKRKIAGTLSTVEVTIRTRRPTRSARVPAPIAPTAFASTNVVASRP